MTVRRYCGARKRQARGTCRRPAGWGTDHAGIGRCKLHGGSTRTGRKAAERAQAEEALAMLGLPRDVEPAEALYEELCRAAGHVAWLGAVIADLPPQELPTSAWLPLYQAERDRLTKVAKVALDMGLTE